MTELERARRERPVEWSYVPAPKHGHLRSKGLHRVQKTTVNDDGNKATPENSQESRDASRLSAIKSRPRRNRSKGGWCLVDWG